MSYVYFVQQITGGPIKIGWAADPRKRIYTLQLSNPVPLVILAVMPGTLELEKDLHLRFETSMVLGEWFDPSPELLQLISKQEQWNYRTTRGVKLSNHYAWKGAAAGITSKRQRLQRSIPLQMCEECKTRPAKDRVCRSGNYDSPAVANALLLCRRCTMRRDGRLDVFISHSKQREPQPIRPCSHCTRPWKPLRRGLCQACYEYKRRTGNDRPLFTIKQPTPCP